MKTACKPWAGTIDGQGYGRINRRGRAMLAHRHVWEEANGAPVPHGMVIMHLCDNRPCVNPEHLQLGTHAANQKDKTAKGRQAKGEGNGRAKLIESQVIEILEQAAAGRTSRDIARTYDVDPKTVYKILHGLMWKEVSGAWRGKTLGNKAERPTGASR